MAGNYFFKISTSYSESKKKKHTFIYTYKITNITNIFKIQFE